VTKAADGTTTAEPMPSTEKEKWGRIAAAVIGGALKGMGAGQGPGGRGKALAAGGEFGMQIPQQQRENAEKDVTADQKRQLFNGNMAKLNLDIAHQTLGNKIDGIKFSQAVSDVLNDNNKRLANAPNAVDMGVTKDPPEAYQLHKTKPELFAGHPNGIVETHPEVDSQGNVLGFHSYLVDRGWQDQTNTEPLPMYQMRFNPTSGKQEPQQVGTIPVGQITNGAYGQLTMSFAKDASTVAKNQADADKAEQDKQPYVPKTAQESAALSALATNPADKAKYDQLSQTQQKIALQQKVAGREGPTAVPGAGGPPAPITDPKYPPAQNFPVGTAGIVPKLIGHVPARVSTNADLARNILENTTAAAKIIQTDGDRLLGPGLGRITSFDEMLGSDDGPMRDLAQRISNIAKATVGIHGSRSKDLVHDEEKKLFNNFKAGKNGALSALNANVDSAQTFLESEKNWQTYGSSTGPDRSLMRGGQPNPNPNPNPKVPILTPGKIPVYVNGKLVGQADDKKGTNYHAF
jgi:hypothetical protein